MSAANSSVPERDLRPEDSLYAALKREILLGVLRPRERLLEADIAERFSIGRHAVRVALDNLDRAGLVERKANKGAAVREYADEEIDKLYEMREILQQAAIERIELPASAELVDRLSSINAVYLEKLEERDLPAVIDANDEFHRVLYGACGNPFLEEAIEQFWLKTAAIHCYAIARPDLAKRSHDEHERIIDALRSGEREALRQLCIDHMYPALAAYRDVSRRWRP